MPDQVHLVGLFIGCSEPRRFRSHPILRLEQQLDQERQASQEADRARQALQEATSEAESRLAQAQSDLSHSRTAVEAAERQLRLVNLQSESRIQELEAQLEQKQQSLIALQTKLNELLQSARSDARAAGEQAMARRSRLDQLAGSLEGAIPASTAADLGGTSGTGPQA